MKKIVSASEFEREVRRWAEEIGVRVKEIHLRGMKRKWASCSSKAGLRHLKRQLSHFLFLFIALCFFTGCIRNPNPRVSLDSDIIF
ncbi:MAG: DUF45 domain-containing protein [Candidatus Aminicenantes bacterium]|nr:DUF45 domain-containing protein [Candidatus Aminicenantes bacterium]